MSVSVAVLGGGNGGHAAAADLSNRGFEVHLYEDARFAPKMQQVFDTHRITMAGAAGNAEVTVAMVTSDPVSYTHLDVYKRQVLERFLAERNPLSRLRRHLPPAGGVFRGERLWQKWKVMRYFFDASRRYAISGTLRWARG